MIGHRAVVGIALEHLAPLIKIDNTEEILKRVWDASSRTLRRLTGPGRPSYRPRWSTISEIHTVVAPAPDRVPLKRSILKHGCRNAVINVPLREGVTHDGHQ